MLLPPPTSTLFPYTTLFRSPVPVLKDVNLDIGPAEFVAIMGPSGSGKSTLMSILGCLDAPSDGTYVFEGRDVGALRDRKSTRLNSSHRTISYAVFCLKKKMR